MTASAAVRLFTARRSRRPLEQWCEWRMPDRDWNAAEGSGTESNEKLLQMRRVRQHCQTPDICRRTACGIHPTPPLPAPPHPSPSRPTVLPYIHHHRVKHTTTMQVDIVRHQLPLPLLYGTGTCIEHALPVKLIFAGPQHNTVAASRLGFMHDIQPPPFAGLHCDQGGNEGGGGESHLSQSRLRQSRQLMRGALEDTP